jgi:ABC-type dipeptide/oligopeptide/nickel transport system ATPase component
MSEREMQKIRGNEIAMIFQDPMTSLNPVMTVAEQISETVQLHQGLKPKNARARALEMLQFVPLSEPEKRLVQYPHELSGGMCHDRNGLSLYPFDTHCRRANNRAGRNHSGADFGFNTRPERLLGTAILLITHDLGVVAEMADRVIVIYAGRKVE